MDKGTIIILVLIGLVLGLALIGVDLVNPIQGETTREDQADKREYMRPVNEASAKATAQSIDALRVYEPTKQAKEAQREENLKTARDQMALENEKAQKESERDMMLIIVITVCIVFLIVVAIGAMLLYKIASARIEPSQPIQRTSMMMIPATGGPQRPGAQDETNPVQALNRRTQSGRSDGHSHSGMGSTRETRLVDDEREPKYPLNYD